ncbi:cupin domain-containing protein [Pantoea wallisii]|uniref:cupin domain-containing protein n=1 Tax=Pantoea wallisii TaxID=1076551 RepID=UPI000FFB900E|nr:cupin domain-containing protein [Pantoea wallisii]
MNVALPGKAVRVNFGYYSLTATLIACGEYPAGFQASRPARLLRYRVLPGEPARLPEPVPEPLQPDEPDTRQFFFVLDGVLTLELGGKEHWIITQQGIEIPPDSKHQPRNDTDSAVEFIVISQPTLRGDRTDLT